MILLAYRHGMRASEVCDLRLSDLDLKNGEVAIRRLKGSLRTVQPLSDHPGQPLLSEKRVLRAWLAERRDASDFVFVSQKGGRIHRSQFFRTFQSIAERAGLPADRRHPHCLKHALGFALVSQDRCTAGEETWSFNYANGEVKRVDNSRLLHVAVAKPSQP